MARLIDTYRGAVYPWHCDHMGHMNVMWYVGKFDEATWQFFALLGLTPEFLRRNRRGMAAVEQRIAYQRELYAGDVVTVGTAALEVRDRVIRFVHEMRNGASADVAAVTMLGCISRHGNTQGERISGRGQGARDRVRRRFPTAVGGMTSVRA